MSKPAAAGSSERDARARSAHQQHEAAGREHGQQDEGSSSKPEQELSAEKRRGAVSAQVAAQLHEATINNGRTFREPMVNPHAAAAEGGKASLSPLISDAPEALRDDLQRALISNGQVQAAGETLHTRRALPSAVHTLRQAMHARTERAIRKILEADTTGMLRLDLATVTATAAKTADLSASWKDFVAVAKEMGGTRGRPRLTRPQAGRRRGASCTQPTLPYSMRRASVRTQACTRSTSGTRRRPARRSSRHTSSHNGRPAPSRCTTSTPTAFGAATA